MNDEYLMHYGVKGMKWGVRHDKANRHVIRNAIGSASGHYSRNKKNTNLPNNSAEAKKMGWKKESRKKSSMHQFYLEDNKRNEKWTSPKGKREVVFSGRGRNQKINKHPEDIGTYNYASPSKRPIGHVLFDTIPYVLLGNSRQDTTSVGERLVNSYNAFKYSQIKELDERKLKYGREIVNGM